MNLAIEHLAEKQAITWKWFLAMMGLRQIPMQVTIAWWQDNVDIVAGYICHVLLASRKSAWMPENTDFIECWPVSDGGQTLRSEFLQRRQNDHRLWQW